MKKQEIKIMFKETKNSKTIMLGLDKSLNIILYESINLPFDEAEFELIEALRAYCSEFGTKLNH